MTALRARRLPASGVLLIGAVGLLTIDVLRGGQGKIPAAAVIGVVIAIRAVPFLADWRRVIITLLMVHPVDTERWPLHPPGWAPVPARAVSCRRRALPGRLAWIDVGRPPRPIQKDRLRGAPSADGAHGIWLGGG